MSSHGVGNICTVCNKIWILSNTRNGIVRHESVMKLRNKLEEFGKRKGINQDEKGIWSTAGSL